MEQSSHRQKLKACYERLSATAGQQNNVDFERLVQVACCCVLSPGAVGVDIGAHKGRHTLPMAETVGEQGKIVAFEPLHDLRQELQTLLAETGQDGVVDLYPFALSDHTAEEAFIRAEGDLGYSGLRQRSYDPNTDVVPTPVQTEVRRLDDVLHVSRCDCIKLDIEGGEYHALLGAKETIRSFQPVCVFEFGRGSFSAYDVTEREMFSFFDSHGYTLLDIVGNPLPSYEDFAFAVRTPGLWDYIARPPAFARETEMASELKRAAEAMLGNGNPVVHKQTAAYRNPATADGARVVVLCPNRSKLALYDSWINGLSIPAEVIVDYGPDLCLDESVAMLITHEHRTEPTVSLCCRAMDMDIPVLVLPDGIIEYRNTWCRPDAVPASLFQPVQGHKFASMGPAQTRTLEAWGNAGKCENVGCPKFDSLIQLKRPARDPSQPWKLLVLTANKPAFTETQTTEILRSLRDLKTWADAQASGEIEAVWRLTSGWDELVGLDKNELNQCTTEELSQLLSRVDAVVTTPSTTIVEAFLLDLPVASLDYTNSPQFVHTAWSITAPEHIQPVMQDLQSPAPAKTLFQKQALHDALVCESPAAPRMVQLVEKMLEIAAENRQHARPMQFPARLLQLEPACPRVMPEPVDWPNLYDHNPELAAIRSYESLCAENIQLRATYRETQQFIKTWQTLGEQQRNTNGSGVVLFGAGKFCKRFLKAVSSTEDGPRIHTVVDDHAIPEAFLAGHLVQRPEELAGHTALTVVLMTDSFENQMRERAAAVFGPQSTVYTVPELNS